MPWGQVHLHAILVPVVASLITSGLTGITTYTVAKGQVAAAYEARQSDQQRAIDRLTQSDLETRARLAMQENGVKRIEASVESIRALVAERLPRRR